MRAKRWPKPKYTGPPPARSAATKELSKELGLPWIEAGPTYYSDDLPCAACGQIKSTSLRPVSDIPSGFQRLCAGCAA